MTKLWKSILKSQCDSHGLLVKLFQKKKITSTSQHEGTSKVLVGRMCVMPNSMMFNDNLKKIDMRFLIANVEC